MKRKLFYALNLQLFAEEEKPAGEKMSADEYAAEIKKLKENTVPKEEYDRVIGDNKTLIKALADGTDVPEAEKQELPDVNQLRKDILNAGETNMSNAEYVQKVLDLRNALLAEGKEDPFLPRGMKRKAENVDIAGAQKVADFLQDCIDESRGEDGKIDNDLFNAHLKKGIANDSPVLTAKLKSLGIK